MVVEGEDLWSEVLSARVDFGLKVLTLPTLPCTRGLALLSNLFV